MRFFLAVAGVLAGLGGSAQAQATIDGANGRTGTGATLGFAAVRPWADPSQACRHGANGPAAVPTAAPDCGGGLGQPTLAQNPGHAPVFTGGVFGPDGRGADARPRQ